MQIQYDKFSFVRQTHSPEENTVSVTGRAFCLCSDAAASSAQQLKKGLNTEICLLCLLKRKDRGVRVGRGDGESQWSGDALLHTCLAPRSRARLCSRQTDLSSRLEEFYLISVAGFTSNIGFRFSTNRKREVKRNNSNYEAQRLQIHSRHMLHVIKLIQKAFGYHYLQRKWANKQTKKNQVKPVG